VLAAQAGVARGFRVRAEALDGGVPFLQALRALGLRAVAVQADPSESKGSKPVSHVMASRVGTRSFGKSYMGHLRSTCVQPPTAAATAEGK
jgi:hypothetical protein